MKIFKKLSSIFLCLSMALGVGFAISSNSSKAIPVHATDYTKIASYNFNGTGSGTSEYNTTTLKTRFADSAQSGTGLSDIVSSVTASSKVYASYTGYASFGLKFGTSSANGTFTVSLSSSVVRVVVIAAGWGASDTVKVGSASAQTPGVAYTGTNPLKTLTFDISGSSSVQFTFAKRGFIQSIDFYEESQTSCTHNWVAGTIHAPTCTEAGYTEYECSLCHDTKTDDEVAALGHNYVAGTPVAATCTEGGYTPYTCSRCSDSYHGDETAALGHNFVDHVCTRCGADEPNETTITTVIKTYAEAHSWGSSSSAGQKTIEMDSNITATCNDGTNSGKYYDPEWRIYQTETGKVTITASNNYSLISVIFVFNTANGGKLSYNSSVLTSGTAVSVSGTSAEFVVGNTGSATNGQVKISSISVTYSVSTPTPVSGHNVTFNENAGGDTVTGMPSTLENQSGTVSLESLSSPSRSGYTFQGWSETASGSVVTSVTVGDSDVEVFAIWDSEPTPVSNLYKFFKLSSVDDITTGKYLIVGNVGGSYHGASGTLTSGKYSNTTLTVSSDVISDSGSAIIFDIEKETSSYIIKNGSKYVNYVSSTNLGEGDSSYSWTIEAGSRGTFRLNSATSGRAFVYREGTTNKFGGYATSNITSTSEYYDVELFRAFTAEDFADHIMTKINCNAQGTSAPTYATGYSWSVLKTEYTDNLTTAEKEILQTAIANEDGNTIQQAMARYDYIVGKYSYENFIGRTVTPISGSRILMGMLNTDASTMVVVIVALISTTSILAFLLYTKKKKYNN